MTLVDLLSELRQKGIHSYLQDGELRFKAPPRTVTPGLKAALAVYRAELAEYLRETSLDEMPPLLLASRSVVPPLSFSQLRLWVLAHSDPNSAFYNIPVALRLGGQLDRDIFRRTLNEVVRRHEVLRTTFVTVEGQPVQRITPELEVEIPVVDLSGLPEVEREAEVQRRVLEEAQKPFDLATGPLLRVGLLVLDAEEHLLLLTMHHIVSDGWSTGVLIREFVALYEALSAGRRSPLPELAIQYADYAVWQREWLQGEVLERQLTYWKGQLQGAPAVLELPTDRPWPAVQPA